MNKHYSIGTAQQKLDTASWLEMPSSFYKDRQQASFSASLQQAFCYIKECQLPTHDKLTMVQLADFYSFFH
jgi:hypothetical protein